jgi:predicted dehydrogenase
MKTQLNSFIVGCGNIAGGYDNNYDSSIKTHIKALNSHDFFNVVGCFDINLDVAFNFSKYWNIKFYFTDLSKKNIKYIVCEKPLTESYDISKKIKNFINLNNTNIVVNYIRRYSNSYLEIKNNISLNKYGSFKSGVVTYGKGIKNNASHAINLLSWFFGDIKSYEIFSYQTNYFNNDPSFSFCLYFDQLSPVFFHPIDYLDYNIFELDLFFQNARINFVESGNKIVFYDEIVNINGNNFFKNKIILDNQLSDVFTNILNNIKDNFLNGFDLINDLDSAIKTDKIVSQIVSNKISNHKGVNIVE